MNKNESLEHQVKAQFLDLLNQGVDYFGVKQTLLNCDNFAQNIENREVDQRHNCSSCALSLERHKVIYQPYETPKDYFILCSFPEDCDEELPYIGHKESSLSVVINLLDKLEITNNSFISYCLKCVPKKILPEHVLATCVSKHLKQELLFNSPKTVLAFGTQAHLSITSILKPLETLDATHTVYTLGAHKIECYFLPSSLELKHFPKLRLPVWNALSHLKRREKN